MNAIAIFAVAVAFGSLGCAASPTPCPHAVPTSIEAERPLTVRAEAGCIWASPHAWSEPRRAWSMPARGPVEDLVLQPRPYLGGFVVTFRQGGVAWRGELSADRTERGPLRAMPEPLEGSEPDLATAGR
jgi:hypothetical protein